MTMDFEQIVRENEQLIHYHIHRLHIQDRDGYFFAEGLEALWNAYESYNPELGQFSTYISWRIRNALIDCIRKEARNTKHEETYFQEHANMEAIQTEDIIQDHYLWEQVKEILTENQWKWVYYFVIHDLSVDQIAKLENVTRDAVKNWGRHARNKLRKALELETRP
ncbi:sigma-70 family RNA polymerase sigma factor [Halobacillus shinanisalinarum]|uniref:Sigma-70 family RNA polymerase sigma factor n=1 Tax=Halobacillus shinanisalinarum TaxID=2932258 RepID=A0ABY4H7B4_9BACI|nr:sigma-70 family RNA polymerase sigma factor [Halobacillus shinanisalinarum]UOQ94867.1 sigma-70 family RNA polymerase sigma factor [Halobacillus shinanisalinarum]